MADGAPGVFSFEGRINRGTFWRTFLFMILGVIVLGVGAAVVIPMFASKTPAVAVGSDSTAVKGTGAMGMGGGVFLVAMVAFYAVVLWINLAMHAKRWHDLGKTGWLALLAVIPAIGFFVFLYLGFAEGEAAENRFGPAPA